jgi:hypothetical protein
MDHARLSDRLKDLQRELAEISEHNRQYFSSRNHSPSQRAQHDEFITRVYAIREELRAMMERTAA